MAAVQVSAAVGERQAAPITPETAALWRALEAVPDPEVPVLSVVDLGIVRAIDVDTAGAVTVTLTPTYSGCPATEVIADAVYAALIDAGAARVTVQQRHAPAWTTDWIGDAAREKLRAYGIAPPAHLVGDDADAAAVGRPLHFHPRGIACPRCGSTDAQRLSAFGATACKALYRCLACREPFEYFKPL